MDLELLKALYKHSGDRNSRIHKAFNFEIYNSSDAYDYPGKSAHAEIPNCGTTGCLAGELPAITNRVTFDWKGVMNIDGETTNSDKLGELFDISAEAAQHLFFPDCQQPYIFGGRYIDDNHSLRDARRNLKAFIENAEKGEINEHHLKYTEIHEVYP